MEKELKEICREIECEIKRIRADEVSGRLALQMREFAQIYRKLPEIQKREALWNAAGRIDKEKYLSAIYMYSVLTFYIHERKWMVELLEIILNSPGLRADTLYFLYWQIAARFVNDPECESETGKALHWKLFQRICNMYAKNVRGLEWIKQEDRNREFVVVIMTQYAGVGLHGPSKTALDRCRVLIEVMRKRVLLINTAEAGSMRGCIPFIGMFVPEYMEELCNEEYLEWKTVKVPFFQCENNMPDINVLQLLSEKITGLKPQFILEIGTGSILANLLSRSFPVLSVVTGFSRLSVTETQYQVSAAAITDKERWILSQVGKEQNHVIPSVFTFGLAKQQMFLNRNELGLPDNKFLIAVVGTRLDREIDDAFMKMLCQVDNAGIGCVFIGEFENFNSYIQKYSELDKCMYYLGSCNDVLAVLEVCDLFVNPIRLGGGTSAAEAMSKGLPVVSAAYGDVGVTVGESFWVEDYCEMAKFINRYQQDKSFYKIQSELAKKRSELLLDTDREFVNVIREFGKRMGEHYADAALHRKERES